MKNKFKAIFFILVIAMANGHNTQAAFLGRFAENALKAGAGLIAGFGLGTAGCAEYNKYRNRVNVNGIAATQSAKVAVIDAVETTGNKVVHEVVVSRDENRNGFSMLTKLTIATTIAGLTYYYFLDRGTKKLIRKTAKETQKIVKEYGEKTLNSIADLKTSLTDQITNLKGFVSDRFNKLSKEISDVKKTVQKGTEETNNEIRKIDNNVTQNNDQLKVINDNVNQNGVKIDEAIKLLKKLTNNSSNSKSPFQI